MTKRGAITGAFTDEIVKADRSRFDHFRRNFSSFASTLAHIKNHSALSSIYFPGEGSKTHSRSSPVEFKSSNDSNVITRLRKCLARYFAYFNNIFIAIGRQVEIGLTKASAAILTGAFVGKRRPSELAEFIANDADIIRWYRRVRVAHLETLT